MKSQRQTKSMERNERIPEKTKQKELIGAGSNRTLLQSDQMSIWLQTGQIQRTRKKPGISIHFVGINQSVHAQRKIRRITSSKKTRWGRENMMNNTKTNYCPIKFQTNNIWCKFGVTGSSGFPLSNAIKFRFSNRFSCKILRLFCKLLYRPDSNLKPRKLKTR